MKIAFYNVENIFHRDAGLVQPHVGRGVKMWMEELETYLTKDRRTDRDYERMRELSFLLGFERVSYEPYVVMRRRWGGLYIRKRGHTMDYKADSLTHWNGWIKVQTFPVGEQAIANKARVIREVNPDILLLQEVEDRTTVEDFNDLFFSQTEESIYHHFHVLCGHDYRGLEMGVMSNKKYPVHSVRSLNVLREGVGLFPQDFQHYTFQCSKKKTVHVLFAQLQSPTGKQEWVTGRRKAQAHAMGKAYRKLRGQGEAHIIMAGTFYMPYYADALSPIFRDTDVKDISKHPTFQPTPDNGKDGSYFRLGAYRLGVNIRQEDFLLLSPELFDRVTASGLNRKGMWPKNRSQWETYDTVQNEQEAASHHPLLWCDLDI
ncbi:endonuclease/exonuclease/phosphatase family protein [Sinomicrobium soli]|uniref:endonuclease/exonuclease/phosphatase family protein n=1 Tax=Sinomicrobium sp. N-1-3-6 TaxID=2219864 RepID=UPI000DCBED48|nr:endonuclease/exonuclease/phosphatase family protein [Sinomicrobium sp. N-1-3-6]RAV29220.1 hypothetical protein DN748_09890 [Sinomicrobium sp. N-1-3-6]